MFREINLFHSLTYINGDVFNNGSFRVSNLSALSPPQYGDSVEAERISTCVPFVSYNFSHIKSIPIATTLAIYSSTIDNLRFISFSELP